MTLNNISKPQNSCSSNYENKKKILQFGFDEVWAKNIYLHYRYFVLLHLLLQLMQ